MNKTKVALIVSSVIALASCGSDEGKNGYPENQVPEFPVYEAKPSLSSSVTLVEGKVDFPDIGVHDPSVIKVVDEDAEKEEERITYYIYGSHLAAAKSHDLINWEYISNPGDAPVVHNIDGEDKTRNELVVDDSPMFQTYTSEISEGIDWTDGWEGNWAANVIQAPNGKFWFYYNHCAQDEAVDDQGIGGGCWHRSYLGLAESDSPEGPFVDKGVFLRTGYRSQVVDDLDADGNQQFQKDADGNNVLDADGNPIVLTKTVFPEMDTYPLDNGQDTYYPAVDPNAIDPTAFFDKEGKMWMVYGSYSGGIYILELDSATGMPVAGQGYGKHLVGGEYRSIEGSYVMYSPESDYYYLMWSIAGFNTDGGYNVRIARSKTPDGPYLDPQGNDISTIKGTNEIGGKLIGGFKITQDVGEEAPAWGYAAPGHHSTIYDEATGRHLMVMHTRFPAGVNPYPWYEAHAVRTHEMFVTSDDWLVVSPQRYVPIEGDNALDVNSMAGYYKFVDHGSATNTVPVVSGSIWLNENRTVSGSATGMWYMLDKNTIRLELSSGTYTGVAKWQWDNGRGELVPTFSAMSSAGATVWGSKVDLTNSTAATLDKVKSDLEIATEVTIFDTFTLPSVGKNGASITWSSSDTYYIENDGTVFIPTPDRGDQVVTMTATIELNGQTTTKDIDVTLKARDGFKNAVAHYKFENSLGDSLQTKADATVTGDRLNNTGGTLVYKDDTYGGSVDFDATYGLLFPQDLIQSYEYTVSFWIKPHAFTNFTSSFYGGATADPGGQRMNVMPMGWVGDNFMIWSASGADGVFVDSWQGIPLEDWSHITVTVNQGDQRLYINGSLAASATGMFDLFSADGGVFGFGVNYWDIPLNAQVDELIVYDYALTPLDIVAAPYNNLTDETQFAGFVKAAIDLGDLTSIRNDFDLPRVGPFVSGISWASNNSDVIEVVNGTAVVTQPGPQAGDATVILTATVNYAGNIDTVDFEVTVKSKAPAEYSFEGELTAKDGAADPAKPVGAQIQFEPGANSVAQYTDGISGQALLLDGTYGYRLPDNLITSDQYSISVWLKPTAKTGYTTALFGASSTSKWLSFAPQLNNLDAGPDNSSAIWVGDGGWWNDLNFGSNVFPNDTWTHVVVTVDGSNAVVYLNGEMVNSSSSFPELFSLGLTTQWAIGVNFWPDTPFNGAVDELKFFYEPISAEKVAELYTQP